MCRVAPAAAEGLCVLEQYLNQTGLCKAATAGPQTKQAVLYLLEMELESVKDNFYYQEEQKVNLLFGRAGCCFGWLKAFPEA